jgi:hypothetical protein
MPVVTTDGLVRLTGVVAVEEAEPLLAALDAAPGRGLDLRDVTAIHSAVLQVILAFRPAVVTPPEAPDVTEILAIAGLLPDQLRDAA